MLVIFYKSSLIYAIPKIFNRFFYLLLSFKKNQHYNLDLYVYQSQDILTFWLVVLYINTLGNRNSRSVSLSYFYAPLLDTYTLSQH